MYDLKDTRELFNHYFSNNPQVCCLINDILDILDEIPRSQPKNIYQIPHSKCKLVFTILKEIILEQKNSTNHDLPYRNYLTELVLDQPEELHRINNDDLRKFKMMFKGNSPPLNDNFLLEFNGWLSDMIYRILEHARVLVSQLYFLPEITVENSWEIIFHQVNFKMDRLKELETTHQILKLRYNMQKNKLKNLLNNCIVVTENILEKNGEDSSIAFINIQISCARAFIDAMSLKMRVSGIELAVDSIQTKKIDVLRNLFNLLKSQKAQLKHDLDHVKKVAEAYENSDPEFKQLVFEYDELKKITNNQNWTINECINQN